MTSNQFITELGIALQAQHQTIKEIEFAISELNASFTESAQKLASHAGEVHQLQELKDQKC